MKTLDKDYFDFMEYRDWDTKLTGEVLTKISEAGVVYLGDVQLSSLVGKRGWLSAVDYVTDDRSVGYVGINNSASIMRWCFDGVVYVAAEDKDDGYRSTLGHVRCFMNDTSMTNKFPPTEVEIQDGFKTRYGYSGELPTPTTGIQRFVCVENGLSVLEVGTDYADDYYPACVMSFRPENLPCNSGVKDETKN